MMSQPRRESVSSDSHTPAIAMERVSKTFEGRAGTVDAVKEIDLVVDEGEFVSVLGPSGCGKTSLMRMIAGIIPVSAGNIWISGRPVDGPQDELGIVFQRDLLMDWRTVLGNVLIQAEFRKLPMETYRTRALQLLSDVGLGGFEDRYPAHLSGGMRQRVAICRAMLHDPELLLMDEPFGALDALTRERMNLELQSFWHGERKTVVFITHSISEAVFLSDRVFVMSPRPGRIVEVLNVPLARPREINMQDSESFSRLAAHIHSLFKGMGVFGDSLDAGSDKERDA